MEPFGRGGEGREKAAELAGLIFEAFPEEVSGMRFYILDCGCLYFQRILMDGTPDPELSTYHQGGEGQCEVCLMRVVDWRQMVVDQLLVYRVAVVVG